MATLTERLQAAVTALMGPSTGGGRLARRLDVNPRRASEWLSGRAEPPEGAVLELETEAAKVGPGPRQELEVWMERAIAAGAHPETVSAMLASAMDQISNP